MNLKHWQPVLPALALPLLAASCLAQTTGVSHPDETDETAQVAASSPTSTGYASGSDHYVMPSRAAGAATGMPAAGMPATAGAAQAAPTPYATGGGGEAMSYAATGPVPAPVSAPDQVAAPAPGLLSRQPSSNPSPGATSYPANSYPASNYPATTYAAPPPAYTRPERAAGTGDDSGIVMEVPVRPFELPAGAVLKARLDGALGTSGTPVGSPFTAQLAADAVSGGQVLLPAGSVIRGRVTAAHGGKRITGGAALRLQPQSITLPDGTRYLLIATLADVEGADVMHVNNEGTIRPKSYTKEAVAIIGGATAVAAVTGAVLGGGVGAVVGASIGAGIGAIVWLRQDKQANLPEGTLLYFALDEPLQLSPR